MWVILNNFVCDRYIKCGLNFRNKIVQVIEKKGLYRGF